MAIKLWSERTKPIGLHKRDNDSSDEVGSVVGLVYGDWLLDQRQDEEWATIARAREWENPQAKPRAATQPAWPPRAEGLSHRPALCTWYGHYATTADLLYYPLKPFPQKGRTCRLRHEREHLPTPRLRCAHYPLFLIKGGATCTNFPNSTTLILVFTALFLAWFEERDTWCVSLTGWR